VLLIAILVRRRGGLGPGYVPNMSPIRRMGAYETVQRVSVGAHSSSSPGDRGSSRRTRAGPPQVEQIHSASVALARSRFGAPPSRRSPGYDSATAAAWASSTAWSET
jgi:hypothetical protein